MFEHVFVTTKHIFCRDKGMLVATKLLSRQNATSILLLRQKSCFVATDTCFVATNTCFVATNTCLSQLNFCRDKKMILVAAPANDSFDALGAVFGVWLGLTISYSSTIVIHYHDHRAVTELVEGQ